MTAIVPSKLILISSVSAPRELSACSNKLMARIIPAQFMRRSSLGKFSLMKLTNWDREFSSATSLTNPEKVGFSLKI